MWAHRTNSIRREACCRITRTASLAVSAGTARITATYQGKVGSFGVLVQTSIASIAVSGVTSLTALGSASQFDGDRFHGWRVDSEPNRAHNPAEQESLVHTERLVNGTDSSTWPYQRRRPARCPAGAVGAAFFEVRRRVVSILEAPRRR
jgi:hypothetical protein